MRAKFIVLTGMAFALTLLSGCMEDDLFKGEEEKEEEKVVEEGEEKDFNTFDFSTVNPATTLEVAYLNTGVKARVYFELYDVMPVIENKYSYSKRPDVTPLFAAYTNTDGVFRDNVSLPAYLKKVYIYSPAFYARTLIEADVVNGSIKATDAVEVNPGTKSVTRAGKKYDSYDSYMVMEGKVPEAYRGNRWKTFLEGGYNGMGFVKYEGKLSDEILRIGEEDVDDLYVAHSSVIDVNKTCPDGYRRYTDFKIDENAKLAVTFLGQNTCWNCSLGYYYYRDGNAPKSLNEANVIMLFPNTQDGTWKGRQDAWDTRGIERGTVAQLKFYGDSYEKENETDTFPAGYRIGFVLANNAWSNRIPEFNGDKKYRAATSEGLSVDNNGNPYDKPRTAAYKYKEYNMISFEDHTDDQNFSDVVITMTSNPENAITNVPTVEPDDPKPVFRKGFYAFEDLWPSEGDYDMNDVVVRYDYEQELGDENNRVKSESFIFTTYQNCATLQNGLAFRVEPSDTPTAVKGSICLDLDGGGVFTEANFTEETDGNAKVYLLTEDVSTDMGATYKVTFEYDHPVAPSSNVDPFIYRNSGKSGKRWEVHLTNTAPTSKMDPDYFHTGSDTSDPEIGRYYVRDRNYPFAIFLSGATPENVEKLLDPQNESKPIDELYPGYSEWVESYGNENADWYKH
ncbi:LruC domain-containing protein [Parabacteroides sp. ZJ-118]|uniref:LruC domain-containing protein n=1 Tax=Parabacteroides sp. ZJ-118 TaxID=2709398 RepID=UPI0013EA2C85|nr:LruC domain-containing protein [Parabacteroides sp. ZJ-118]